MDHAKSTQRNRSACRIRTADEADHFALAIELCRAHLKCFPNDAPILGTFGRTLVTMARYREAEVALNEALRLAPKERRHLIYWQLGHLEEAKSNPRLARSWHRKAARLRPDEASSFIYLGSIAFSEGKLREAERLHRRALNCSEGAHDEAWFNLGGALLAQDRLEEARECYVKAITIDPKYGIAKKRLMDVELAIAERAQDAPKPPHPRKSRRAAAKTPTNAVRARSRSR